MQMNKVKIAENNDMSKVDLIMHILDSLSEEYEIAVSFLEDYLMNSSVQVTLGIETARKNIILWQDRLKQHEKDEIIEQGYFAFKK